MAGETVDGGRSVNAAASGRVSSLPTEAADAVGGGDSATQGRGLTQQSSRATMGILAQEDRSIGHTSFR